MRPRVWQRLLKISGLILISIVSFNPTTQEIYGFGEGARAAIPPKIHTQNLKKTKWEELEKPTLSSPKSIDLAAVRAQQIYKHIAARPLRTNSLQPIDLSVAANKISFLNALYKKNLVEASNMPRLLADKLIFYEVAKLALGDRVHLYLPRTLGLRDFLWRNGLLDQEGNIKASGEQIEVALHLEFSAGFVVRPAVGVAPTERDSGLYREDEEIVVDLLKPQSRIYNPSHFRQPVRSHILGGVASGEAVVLQENVVRAADAYKPLLHKRFFEVRVHTFESHVVPDSVPERWVQNNLLGPQQIERAEKFVEEFLSRLPVAMTSRQAWGVDVAVMDNGDMRIIEIVTNRGKPGAWSSYLEQPRVLAAYAKHLESCCGLEFGGLSGSLLKHGWANYGTYWQIRREKAKSPWQKMLSYLPPWP